MTAPIDATWEEFIASVEDERTRAELASWGALRPQTADNLPLHIDPDDAATTKPNELEGFEFIPQWKPMRNVTDSAHWKVVAAHLAGGKSAMVIGRAGTGKTYLAAMVATELSRAYGADAVQRVAFTHTAANAVGGSTIHNFLRIGFDGRMRHGITRDKRRSAVRFLIVDEISMIPGLLWQRLDEVRRMLGFTMLLVGDHRQCAPPEVRPPGAPEDHYLDHSAIMDLADSHRAILTKRRRYDKALWDLLERMDPEEIRARAGDAEMPVAIARLNATRVWVNEMWMRRRAPEEGALFLPGLPLDEYSQDTWVYPGLPVQGACNVKARGAAEVAEERRQQRRERLAELREARQRERATHGRRHGRGVVVQFSEEAPVETAAPEEEPAPEEPEYVLTNGERLTVISVAPDAIVCRYEGRPQCGGATYSVAPDDFQRHLRPAYCVTVEKAQGATIREAYTIYDFERMDERLRYTALSRATCVEHINLRDAPAHVATLQQRVRHNVAKKVQSVVRDDLRKGRRRPDLTAEHILAIWSGGGAETCPVCGKDMLWHNWQENSDRQFSIDAVDERRAHDAANVRIVCWGCNRAKENRVDRPQGTPRA